MLSKSCQYALRAVVYIAAHSTTTHLVGAQEMADGLDIPKHFLSKILQQLTRNQVISSTKGPHGGFFLSKENERITIDRIVEIMDGPGLFKACVLGLPQCSSTKPCPLHFQAVEYRDGLYNKLKRLNIKELALVVHQENIKI
ncbi:MAG: Rrf2 family transcriptional regulator [Saprospiraceae bacterium]|nr:Rrf2 family transcriptional regulator [Saprospiraceae bacterium]